MGKKRYIVPEQSGLGPIIVIDPELCSGCNSCVNACRQHMLLPNPVEGKPPIITNAEECWLAGCCAELCPIPGAIKVIHPLVMRVGWKRKDTGAYYRIGMKNPPPPNTRPPANWTGTDITRFSSGRDVISIYDSE